MRFQLSNGNIILADQAFIDQHHPDAVALPDEVIPEPKSWPAFDFYRKFTVTERIAVRELAQTDPIAADFYATLMAAISSATPVHADDHDVISGLQYLSGTPSNNPVLAAGRAAVILG